MTLLKIRQKKRGSRSLIFNTFFSISILTITSAAFCQSQNLTTNVQGDLTLLWIDDFKNPLMGIIQDKPNPDANGTTSKSDLLGLKKARFQFEFAHGKKSKLSMVVRPDSLKGPSNQSVMRELDTRVGSVLDPSPSVQFFDSYEIQLTPLKALSASFGVFEYLNQSIAAFHSNLDFGLELRPVAKSSGLWLRWIPESQKGSTAAFDMILFQGNDERGEFATQTPNDSRSSKYYIPGDRKNGGALSGSFQPTSKHYLYGFLSYHESQKVPQIDSSRFFLQIGTTYLTSIFTHPLDLALDSRYIKESFSKDPEIPEGSPAELSFSHWSSKLSGSLEIVPEFFILSNIQYGVNYLPTRDDDSDPTEKVRKVRGYLLELGLRSGDHQGIHAQILLTEESRRVEGSRTASFITREGNFRNLMRRISLGVSYKFNSRI